ncbi:MAG: helicase-related protein [Pseudomonadota bacterium]|nr:helicase-related protein [Pseudomonadota bacterium]
MTQDSVRAAFNSPFRPFVLTSTSIGQEGLDFHPWCHRLVHWNLPGNPVDLEQREGRIHRYKGHAARFLRRRSRSASCSSRMAPRRCRLRPTTARAT